MKLTFFFLLLCQMAIFARSNHDQQMEKIRYLIGQYAAARETQDGSLLKKILTEDIDQLVSNGQWRNGIGEAISGMQASTQSNPGTRSLVVDKIKFLSEDVAIVDCRYIIVSSEATKREMWSSFSVVKKNDSWKIAAIRNMSPSAGN